MKPSMKPGSYHVWLLLGHTGPFATVEGATCDCAAGLVYAQTYEYMYKHMNV